MALSLRTFLAFESTVARANSKCSDETNSSFICVGQAFGRFEDLLQRLRDVGPGSAGRFGKWPSSAWIVRSSCWRLTPILSRIGPTIPSPSEVSPAKQMQRIDLRIAAIGGQLLGAADGLLGFDRQFFEPKCHEFTCLRASVAGPPGQAPPRVSGRKLTDRPKRRVMMQRRAFEYELPSDTAPRVGAVLIPAEPTRRGRWSAVCGSPSTRGARRLAWQLLFDFELGVDGVLVAAGLGAAVFAGGR